MNFLSSLFLRCLLFSIAVAFIYINPRFNEISKHEIKVYSYISQSHFPYTIPLYTLILLIPLSSIALYTGWNRYPPRVWSESFLSVTGALSLTAALVSVLQVISGRRTPDFLSRCFPEGRIDWTNELELCTGEHTSVNQGLRSFPSGLAAWSVCNLFWTSLFVSGKLGIFSPSGKGEFWKLCIFLFINFTAVLVSLIPFNLNFNFSEDILTGGVIGLIVATTFYFLYFPSIQCDDCHLLRSQTEFHKVLPTHI